MKGTLILTLTLLLGVAGFLTTGFAQTYDYHDTLNEGTGLARALAFSPDGSLLASGGGNNIYLHAPGTGMLQRTLRGHTAIVTVVAFSPDGRMLASASGDHTIKLWNPHTGQLIRTLRGHSNQIYAMAFSRTGQQLASGGRQGNVRLWNTQTGTNRVIGWHNGWVLSVAFSSTGLLASSGRDNTIRIWNATTGVPMGALIGHTNFMTSVAFTATGDTLVSGSRDNSIRIWNAATGGAALKTLQGHTDWVNSVAVSASGTIASASADETVRLWNLQTGQSLATLHEHTDKVRIVTFSPNGPWLASGSSDGTVRLWRRSGLDETQVRIPDANLANAIREKLQLGEGAPITAAAMRQLTTLDASDRGVADLTGLQHATNLEVLNLSRNHELSDISALANLTNLERLYLNGTGVSDVSALANLTNLERLNLDETGVSDVSALANLTNLEVLDLNGPGVSDVSALANLTNLVGLDLRETGVSDVSALANLTNLEWLYLNGPGVSDVSALANLTKLKTLDLFETGVSDVSALANLTNLERLNLNNTNVSDVSALVNLTNLERLDLRRCPLSHASLHTHIPALQAKGIEVEFYPQVHIPDTNLAAAIREKLQFGEGVPITVASLWTLNASDRGIVDLTGLQHATKLESLNLSRNHELSDISALANLTNLEVLDLTNTGVSDVSALANLTKLKSLSLGNTTGVSDISALANLTNLEWLSLGNTTGVSDVSALANLTNLERLYLNGTGVSDVSALANLTNLERLDLRRCPLSHASLHTHIPALQAKGIEVVFDPQVHIPDTNLAAAIREKLQFGEGVPITVASLWTLNASDRGIVDLTGLQHATKLESLNLSRNHELSDISALANLTNLEVLYLRNTGVSDVSALANLTNLERLYLRNTGVSDVSALANLTKLKTLDLGETGVSDVSALANLTNLEWLSLWNTTGVSDVSALANLTNLEVLNLFETGVSDVSALANLTNLEVLYLRNTGVSDVSALANLTNLERLYLRNTGVSDVSALANLTKLKSLGLGETGVSDVSALANLTNLEWLYLRDTGVSDVSALANLTNLKELYLYDCPLRDASLYTHIPALQAKGIKVYFTYPVGCGTLMPWNLEPLRPVKIEPITRKREIVSEGDFQGATVKFAPVVGESRAWTTGDTVANDDKVGTVVITASIAGGTAAQKREIKRAAAEWSLYGNLLFLFVESGEADVRISIDPEKKGNSGQATLGASSESKMTLSESFSYGVCLHEFGHVLGLHHEQVSPKFTELVEWALEEEELIPALKTHGRQNWTDKQIRDNILTVHEVGEAAKFDPHSIMTYGMNKGLVKARPDAPNPTLANEIAENGMSHNWELSTDDKGLLKHIYGSPTLKAVVGGSISIEGVDDETGKFKWEAVKVLGIPVAPKLVQISDEKIDESKGFGPQVFNSVDEYVLTQEEDPAVAFRWGDECRVEVYLSTRKIVEDSHIEMAANVFLFEGSSEDTTDLEDFRCTDFDVPLTGSEKVLTLKLENEFWDDEPAWIIDTRARTCRNVNIGVDVSLLSFQGDVLGGGDWAEVTLSLSAKTFDVEALKDLPGAAAPSAAAVKQRPSQEISDVNGDGQVTVADLVLVSKHIGRTDLSDSRVDLNDDGIVTIVDLVQVAQHLGSSTDPAAPAHIVAPKGLGYETVEGWLAGARAADDGSRLFLQGITNLERLLLLIIPEKTGLLHNYPNPFNPETWIPYHLAESAEVTLTIYTVDGKVVRTLALGHQAAGFYQSRSRAAYWDGRNEVGERVASGVYFYTLSAGNFSATRKLVIRK